MGIISPLPGTIHDPVAGTKPPATWGDAVNSGFVAVDGWKAYAMRATRTTALQIAGSPNTQVTIIFNSELYDYGNAYNPSTGVFTAPATGIYQINSQLSILASNADELVEYSALVDGVWQLDSNATTMHNMAVNNIIACVVAGSVYMTTGQQLTMLAGHYVGANSIPLNIGAPQKNYMSVFMVGFPH